MKLAEHVDHIRTLIYGAFNNQFSRLGVGPSKMMDVDKIPAELLNKHHKISVLIQNHTDEKGNYAEAREKALDELTFTLFNRLAAIKVMEAHQLFPPIITKEAQHGDRSFGHKAWLEQHPEMRDEELEGFRNFLKYEFNQLGESIPLYHKDYPYALLPYVIELNEVIDAFNAVEQDVQVDDKIWQSDDILGWLYESYNNAKKQAHKDSGEKTEFHKVSLQSQVYTPRWVVEFLVNNSLGKLYLEIYPDSGIKDKYKIANAPMERIREVKPLHEIKLIDPASGSGNFLLYAFSLFYELYFDQIENYGADYDEDEVPQLIIENNLHGIDLDDRAVQLAQLGLWIKAKQKQRNIGKLNFNVVSSDFFLPDFEFVYPVFKDGISDKNQLNIVRDIWEDLRQAYKFGSLVKIEEKLSIRLHGIIDQASNTLFGKQEWEEYERFKINFFKNLEDAVIRYARQQGNAFLADKTHDAIVFLRVLSQKYEITCANPPYTSRREYGEEIKTFIDANYRRPFDTYINLYGCFLQRLHELLDEDGKMGMVTPMTFMFISTFEDTRKLILNNYEFQIFVQYGFGGMFSESVDPAFFVLEKTKTSKRFATFIKLDEYFDDNKKELFNQSYINLFEGIKDNRLYYIDKEELLSIKSYPFIYWISKDFREKFKSSSLNEYVTVCQGLATGDNSRFLRYWWELEHSASDSIEWIPYAKGGTFNKWVGNLWLTVNWKDDGYQIKNFKNEKGKLKSRPQNEKYYFEKGITYSASGRGGYAFRILPEGCIFDVGGSSMFPVKKYKNLEYILALMNSKLIFYIANCLNPTANIQVGDLQRVPFVLPNERQEKSITNLSIDCIKARSELLSFNIEEVSYKKSLFDCFNHGKPMASIIKDFIVYKLFLETRILINEHIINTKIFEVYSLADYDINLVKQNQGFDVATNSFSLEAKNEFLSFYSGEISDDISSHIKTIHVTEIGLSLDKLKEVFQKLYNSNRELEDVCAEFNVHPIQIWYEYRKLDIIPSKYMNQKSMEFLIDLVRQLLMEDDDGIIPLVPNAGEKILLDRIDEKFIEKGFTMAQYSSFDKVLGYELNDYINSHLFKNFSDHLNMFSYLPKTPFIWHLTSGPEQGFDCYLIIYKWNKDRLLRLRSVYIENRERSLINRQTDLRKKTLLSAPEQTEVDKIYKQLKEIEAFKQKIDELLEEGYDPLLDDGVGKNIAPLQEKGMLKYDVLNAGQLRKYLNADW